MSIDLDTVARFRLRQVEDMLAVLLRDNDGEDIDLINKALQGAHSDISRQFGVTDRPQRRRRLAADMSAILRLYAGLKRLEAGGDRTICGTSDRLKEFNGTVSKFDDWRRLQETGSALFNSTLAGLTALELYYHRLIDVLIPDGGGLDTLAERHLKGQLLAVVDGILAEARARLVHPQQRRANMTVFHDTLQRLLEIERGIKAQRDDMGERERTKRAFVPQGAYNGGGDVDTDDTGYVTPDIDADGLDDDGTASVAPVLDNEITAPIFQLLAMTCFPSEPSSRLQAVVQGLAQEFAEFEKASSGNRKDPIAPESGEALIWGVTLLVDGWQPRGLTRTKRLGKPVNISITSDGAVATIAQNLAQNMGLGLKGEETPSSDFGGFARRLGLAWQNHGRLSSHRVFSGRRRYGAELGEFEPDSHDGELPAPAQGSACALGQPTNRLRMPGAR